MDLDYLPRVTTRLKRDSEDLRVVLGRARNIRADNEFSLYEVKTDLNDWHKQIKETDRIVTGCHDSVIEETLEITSKKLWLGNLIGNDSHLIRQYEESVHQAQEVLDKANREYLKLEDLHRKAKDDLQKAAENRRQYDDSERTYLLAISACFCIALKRLDVINAPERVTQCQNEVKRLKLELDSAQNRRNIANSEFQRIRNILNDKERELESNQSAHNALEQKLETLTHENKLLKAAGHEVKEICTKSQNIVERLNELDSFDEIAPSVNDILLQLDD
ncbi:Hypothetical predicted protein, partial [Paramuricea clavata]